MKRIAAAAALVIAGGCSGDSVDATGCYPGIPPASQFLRDPEFASLTFHNGQQFEVRRGFGYHIWADSKFDYRTGLEYSIAPKADARSELDVCAFATALRFGLPAGDAEKKKLAVFARAMAPAAKTDPAAFEAQLASILASGDKFRFRTAGPDPLLEAGQLMHPSRGAFFMVKLTWPRPESKGR